MIVEALALLAFVSFTSAGWTYMIEYLITPGQIFGRYGTWIHQMAGNLPVSGEGEYKSGDKSYLKPRWWANPLGACMNCTNVWVTLIWGCLCLLWFDESLWYILAVLPISHWLLRKIMIG